MDQKRRRRDSGSFKKGVVKVSIYAPHLKQFDKILEEDKAMYQQRVGDHEASCINYQSYSRTPISHNQIIHNLTFISAST